MILRQRVVAWDKGEQRVVAREEERLGALVLSASAVVPSAEELHEALLKGVVDSGAGGAELDRRGVAVPGTGPFRRRGTDRERPGRTSPTASWQPHCRSGLAHGLRGFARWREWAGSISCPP